MMFECEGDGEFTEPLIILCGLTNPDSAWMMNVNRTKSPLTGILELPGGKAKAGGCRKGFLCFTDSHGTAELE
jgi:hypothetical protein